MSNVSVPFVGEKASAVSSTVTCAPGTLLTGLSFTALTVIATKSTSVIAPPVPLLPRSSATSIGESAPL